MKLKELTLLNIVKNKKAIRAFSKTTVTVFCTKHSKSLFSGFFNEKDMDYFHITDTTKRRIQNVPISDIDGNKLIDLKKRQSKGIVFFNNGLHFIYLIKNNGVYIMTSSHKSKGDSDLFKVGNIMSGFLYYDFFSGDRYCYINNVLDIMQNNDSGLIHEKESLSTFKNIEMQIKNGDYSLYNRYKDDYSKKWNDTTICLQAFMFINYAKVINTTRITEQYDTRTFTERINNIPVDNINIIKVDTFYDETIEVINPFSVSGHYRNQPIGKCRKDTKLIYIDSFMKTGYTRIATKEKLDVNN